MKNVIKEILGFLALVILLGTVPLTIVWIATPKQYTYMTFEDLEYPIRDLFK